MLRSAFLVTCDKNKETLALREAREMLGRVMFTNSCEVSNGPANIDYRAQAKSDSETLKREKVRAIPLKNVKNIVLLENLTKCDTVSIYLRLGSLSVPKRYVHRVIPLQRLGTLDDVLKCIPADASNINADSGKTYKIAYKQRMSDLVCKDKIFEAITGTVTLKVNLSVPSYVFMVEVVKNLVGYSVVLTNGSSADL